VSNKELEEKIRKMKEKIRKVQELDDNFGDEDSYVLEG
jgi:hypothetical protein